MSAEKTNDEQKEMCEETTKTETTTKAENIDSLTESTEKNDGMDVGSEQFDPIRALYASELKISKKAPKIQYQNLAAFESALKKFGPWGLQQRPNIAGTAAAPSTSKQICEPEVTRRFLPHQMPIKLPPGTGFKHRHSKNLWKAVEKMQGPLKLLSDALEAKQRIRVIVRNEHGVRGHIEGKIICFDKHWNLLMRNVLEVWRRRKFKYGVNKACEAENPTQDCTAVLEELGISLPKQTVKSLNRKNVEVTRNLDQLFVRGEQVVLISIPVAATTTETTTTTCSKQSVKN